MSSDAVRRFRALPLTLADATVGVGAALVAWAVHTRTQPAFVDPHSSGGLATYAAVLLARLSPSTPLAPRLLTLDALVHAIAIGALALVASRIAGSRVAGLAAAIAVAWLGAMAPVMGEVRALSALGAVLVLGGIADRRWWVTLLGLAVGVATEPALAVPFSALAAVAPGRDATWRRRIISGATVLGVGLGGLLLVPSLTGETPRSVFMLLRPTSGLDMSQQLVGVASAAGPYFLGLTIIGVAHDVTQLATPVWSWLLGYLAAAVISGGGAVPLLMILATAAAVGLKGLAGWAGAARGGQLAALFFSALLPALQLQGWLDRHALFSASSHGQETLTLDRFRRTLDALPPQPAIQRDDGLTDVLMRATGTSRRTLTLDDPAADSSAGRLVMPRAQRALAMSGFRLSDVAQSPGFALATPSGVCRGLSERWRMFADWEAPALAISARSAAEYGPVTVYAVFAAPPQIQRLDWPTTEGRGTFIEIFDLSNAAERDRLINERGTDGVPADLFPDAMAIVARLELWRTPDAPRSLSLEFGASPSVVIGAMAARAPVKRLDLCPVFPHRVAGF